MLVTLVVFHKYKGLQLRNRPKPHNSNSGPYLLLKGGWGNDDDDTKATNNQRHNSFEHNVLALSHCWSFKYGSCKYK